MPTAKHYRYQSSIIVNDDVTRVGGFEKSFPFSPVTKSSSHCRHLSDALSFNHIDSKHVKPTTNHKHNVKRSIRYIVAYLSGGLGSLLLSLPNDLRVIDQLVEDAKFFGLHRLVSCLTQERKKSESVARLSLSLSSSPRSRALSPPTSPRSQPSTPKKRASMMMAVSPLQVLQEGDEGYTNDDGEIDFDAIVTRPRSPAVVLPPPPSWLKKPSTPKSTCPSSSSSSSSACSNRTPSNKSQNQKQQGKVDVTPSSSSSSYRVGDPNPPPQYRDKDPSKNLFTWDEIKKHITADDCWLVLQEKVYDVTRFLPDHPAGRTSIVKHAATECSKHYLFHSKFAKSMWKKYHIGYVYKKGGECSIM